MTGPRGLPERNERKTDKSQPQIRKKGKQKGEKGKQEKKVQAPNRKEGNKRERIIMMYITVMALE